LIYLDKIIILELGIFIGLFKFTQSKEWSIRTHTIISLSIYFEKCEIVLNWTQNDSTFSKTGARLPKSQCTYIIFITHKNTHIRHQNLSDTKEMIINFRIGEKIKTNIK